MWRERLKLKLARLLQAASTRLALTAEALVPPTEQGPPTHWLRARAGFAGPATRLAFDFREPPAADTAPRNEAQFGGDAGAGRQSAAVPQRPAIFRPQPLAPATAAAARPVAVVNPKAGNASAKAATDPAISIPQFAGAQPADSPDLHPIAPSSIRIAAASSGTTPRHVSPVAPDTRAGVDAPPTPTPAPVRQARMAATAPRTRPAVRITPVKTPKPRVIEPNPQTLEPQPQAFEPKPQVLEPEPQVPEHRAPAEPMTFQPATATPTARPLEPTKVAPASADQPSLALGPFAAPPRRWPAPALRPHPHHSPAAPPTAIVNEPGTAAPPIGQAPQWPELPSESAEFEPHAAAASDAPQPSAIAQWRQARREREFGGEPCNG